MYKINNIIKKDFFGKEFDVKITNIVVEEDNVELDGSLRTVVYGKIAKKEDVEAIKALQELAKKDILKNPVYGSGQSFQEKSFSNELLLEIFNHDDNIDAWTEYDECDECDEY